LNLKAYAFSEISIAQFLINLTNLDFLDQVSLNQVSSSVDNSAITNFTITAVSDAKQLGGNK
jgi:6-phosphogluconate dehydrogenase (decarboxylating)